MNVIFTAIFALSTLTLLIFSPENFLPSLLNGAENSIKTALTLFCIYAIWMGLSKVAEKSGLTKSMARALSPVCKRVFKTDDEEATKNLAMNLSCNLLGIGGAATPFAVKAIGELEKSKNDYAQNLLFVINATSIQILPTTVIALRASEGSAAAFDIFLPSLVCTAISTATAVGLYILGRKIWR